MSFGKMPIANGFLRPEDFATEYFHDLQVGFCPECLMVQFHDQPTRERMFHERYAFFSSTSTRMAEHFARFAQIVMDSYIDEIDPFIVEIGSNDGILLRHFAKSGYRHLGVEPSENVAAVAMERGIRTLTAFFDETLAERLEHENGKADAVLAANVMCHISDLHPVMAGIKRLLKDRGVLVFEDPYLGDIVAKTAYDQIYDEHAFYFSVGSLANVVAQHGLEIIDVQPQVVHGGSMRYVVAHTGAYPQAAAVAQHQMKERQLGLGRHDTYATLVHNIERSRDELMNLLTELNRRGRRIVGYAATSKSTTVINYCGITSDLVEFISDTTPIKQGTFSPGQHIPVRSHAEFERHYPDYALLFAWNHAEEIFAKETAFAEAGGKWILYVPRVEVR